MFDRATMGKVKFTLNDDPKWEYEYAQVMVAVFNMDLSEARGAYRQQRTIVCTTEQFGAFIVMRAERVSNNRIRQLEPHFHVDKCGVIDVSCR